ncbi:MAG: hypothetical protein ACK4NC_06025 [Candidatus Gracilibacteria bacterium]
MNASFLKHKAFHAGLTVLCIGLLGFSVQGNLLRASVDMQRGGYSPVSASGNLLGDGGFEETEIGGVAAPYENNPWTRSPTNTQNIADAHITTLQKRSGNKSVALSGLHLRQTVRIIPEIGSTYQLTAYLKADRGALTKADTDYYAEGIQVDVGSGNFTMGNASCVKNDDPTLSKVSANNANIYNLFRLDSAKENELSPVPGSTTVSRKYHGKDSEIWNTWQKISCTFTISGDKRPTREQTSAIGGPAIVPLPGMGIQFQKICFKKDEASHSNGCTTPEQLERYYGGKNATVFIDDVDLRLISGNQTLVPTPKPLRYGAIYSSSWKDQAEKNTLLSAKAKYLPADFSTLSNTERMKRDINEASKAHLNFFALEWSWDAAMAAGQSMQEESISDFVSQSNGQMDFALLWNLTEADVASPEAFKTRVLSLKNHTSQQAYLKTATGQPIIFLSSYNLLEQKKLTPENIKALTAILQSQLNAFSIILFDDSRDFTETRSGTDTPRPTWTRYLYGLGFEGAMKRNYLSTFKSKEGWNTAPYDIYQKVMETELNDITTEKAPGASIGFALFPSVLTGREDMTGGVTLTSNIDTALTTALHTAKNAITYLQPVHQLILMDSWNDYLHGSTLVPSEARTSTLSSIADFISCVSTPEKPECFYVK